MKKAAHHPHALPEDDAEAPTAAGQTTEPQTTESQTTDSPPAGDRGPEGWPVEHWTVDGIEDSPQGPLARLERGDGTTFDLPLRLLPEALRESDLLAAHGGPDGVTVRLLVAETMERRRTAQARLDALNNAASDPEGGLQDEDGEITV